MNFSGAFNYRGPVTNGGIINAATMGDGGEGTASMVSSGEINANTYTFGRPVDNSGDINVTTLTGTGSGNSVMTNDGNINVTGNMTFPSSSILYNNPGGFVVVEGNATFEDNENLVNGTSVNPPAYADMLIVGDLNLLGSGDALIDVNGRLAVYGSLNSSGGATVLTIADGGQVFVSGDIDLSNGGGNVINNQNTQDGFMGLYTDGDVLFGDNGGFTGSSGYGNQTGSNSTYYDSDDMATDNPNFLNWVASLPGSPLASALPVHMLTFKVFEEQDYAIILWETVAEINHKQFELFKSEDGVNYTLFESILSENPNNTGNVYEVIDASLGKLKTVYYKLIQEDLDGTKTEIGIRTLGFDEFTTDEVTLFPNPNNGQHITINGEIGIFDNLNIIDIHGNLIPFSFRVKSKDSYFIQFQSPLKSGMYFLTYTANNSCFAKRFIVK